jgi:hypothetical protein
MKKKTTIQSTTSDERFLSFVENSPLTVVNGVQGTGKDCLSCYIQLLISKPAFANMPYDYTDSTFTERGGKRPTTFNKNGPVAVRQ